MCLVEVGWEGEITSVGTALHWVMPVFVPSWDLCTGRGWAATGWMPQARCQGSLQRAVVWWIRGQQALAKFLKSRWFLARQWQKSYWLKEKQIQIIGQGRKKACDRAGRETQISVITLIKKSVFLPFIIWSSSPSNTSPPPPPPEVFGTVYLWFQFTWVVWILAHFPGKFSTFEWSTL